MVQIQQLKQYATRLFGTIALTQIEGVGKHRQVKYGELDLSNNKIVYGYVDGFFVMGIGERSFKTIIDTYRNKAPSISINDRYVASSNKTGIGEISIFCDVDSLVSVEQQDGLEPFKKVIDGLSIFKSLSASLNLRETGNFLKIYTPITPKTLDKINDLIQIPLQHSNKLDVEKTIRALTGEEKLFIAISPAITQFLWHLFRQYIDTEAEGDLYDVINLVEGEYNIDLYDDIIPALTGELAFE